MIGNYFTQRNNEKALILAIHRPMCTVSHIFLRFIYPTLYCSFSASSHLYVVRLSACWLVNPSVFFSDKQKTRLPSIQATLSVTLSARPSVGWSVSRSVTLLKVLPKRCLNGIIAPAQPYLTDAVVYTALFL